MPISLAGLKPYAIIHYDLRIEPDFKTKNVSLSAALTIDNPQLEKIFSFGLNERYSTIEVTSDSSRVEVKRNGAEIVVMLHNPTGIVSIKFTMNGNLGRSTDVKRSIVEDSSLFLLWSDRFYPIDFDHWGTLTTTIVLPQKFQVWAPGKAIEVRSVGKKKEHVFQTTNPATCYSVFADTRWIRSRREINGIPMQTLLYSQSEKYSEQIFSTSSSILKFFSATYCPYPFDEFTFISINDLDARMAFCGAVGYNPEYLEKEMASTGYDAHETALLWWFYTMRGSGPGGFQWTEGLGDYAEMLYCQKRAQPLAQILQRFRDEYLALPASEDVLYYELCGNTPQKIIHGKYPWLMQVLRYVVGERGFLKAMKLVFERFKYRTFTMDEFVTTLEEGCDQSLRWWRDEWLERRGVPEISMTSTIRKGDGLYTAAVVLEQLSEIYHIPVDVGAQTSEGMHIEKVKLRERRTEFSFDLIEKPGNVVLDPSRWLLMRKRPLKE